MSNKTVSHDKNKLREYLFRAFCWLDAPQPENAVVSHLGIHSDIHFSFYGINNVAVSLVVAGSTAWPVIVFESMDWVPAWEHKDGYNKMQQRFNKRSLAFCRAIVREFAPIRDEWNGYNEQYKVYLSTFSISPAIKPGKGAMSTLINYGKYFGCDGNFGVPKRYYDLAVKPLGWR